MPVLDLNDSTAVEKYQNFVQNSEFGRITQDVRWSHVKNNWEPRYVYLKNEAGEITAAMSMLLSTLNNGKKFAYASKGPVVDINNTEMLMALVDEAKKALADDNVYLLRFDPEVDFSEELNDTLKANGFVTRNRNVDALGMHGTIQPRRNMVIDLTEWPDAKETFDLYSSKMKSKLRRPIRDGVTVRWGNTTEELDSFFTSYSEMAERHGISYRPKDYFERLLASFGDSDIMRIYLAEREGELLATGIGFNYGNKIWYMYAGSVDGNTYFAPYAVQTEMIQWALDKHLAGYDMGGIEVADNSDGLYAFKRNFVKADPREYIGEIDVVLDEDTYHEMGY
ncbi:UDP-N-acetylmuramoylpentapeptide-lysine N(6)-alanyltransferase [Weissella koreensis]|uniref:Aminoacyltransferase n=1 Tax=Weissella koreensis TaxID=165096 RepID=A0A7H1ML46_9LACO|nr:peptidoglycan bridge formation glycyltransferase FemA/FemB family protein [Weissella koreensis]AVH74978.1 methicillin resistance protein [Weissella koreensis]QGN20204.1 peptidoglycan bridge formation glycyltransferase FemA/FemB family protein [Weissella koreensis]QNT64182.1 aminoacyltransferase [Weissella koreensis]